MDIAYGGIYIMYYTYIIATYIYIIYNYVYCIIMLQYIFIYMIVLCQTWRVIQQVFLFDTLCCKSKVFVKTSSGQNYCSLLTCYRSIKYCCLNPLRYMPIAIWYRSMVMLMVAECVIASRLLPCLCGLYSIIIASGCRVMKGS